MDLPAHLVAQAIAIDGPALRARLIERRLIRPGVQLPLARFFNIDQTPVLRIDRTGQNSIAQDLARHDRKASKWNT